MSVDTIGDRTDRRYILAAREDATVTVERMTAPDVNDDGTPATDPDGDGDHEDVTDDGDFNIIDVSVVLDRFESTPVEESAALFDFSPDGQVDILDVSLC